MTFYVEMVDLRRLFFLDTVVVTWNLCGVLFAAVKGFCVEFAGVCGMF